MNESFFQKSFKYIYLKITSYYLNTLIKQKAIPNSDRTVGEGG